MSGATMLMSAVPDTMPKLLKRNHEKYGDEKIAMRVKDLGIWQTYTWKDYYEKVKYFSLGLISLGLEWGDKVSILGENKPHWYWAELAAQSAGGVGVGIFTDSMPREVQYFAGHSDSKFVIAHDQEQVDKLIQIKKRLFDILHRIVDKILRFKGELNQDQVAKLLRVKDELGKEEVPEVRRIAGELLEFMDKLERAWIDTLQTIVARLFEIQDKLNQEQVVRLPEIKSAIDRRQPANLYEVVSNLLQFRDKLSKEQIYTREQIEEELLIFILISNLPIFKKVIYWDPKGLWSYDDPILISFNEVIKLGKEYERFHSGLFEANVERGNGNDIAFFCYTSGTTGLPKAAMMKQSGAVQAGQSWWNVDRWRDDEQYVSFLPPAWITEQALGVIGSLISGMEISFPEHAETVQENIREIGAQVLFWGPRNWESANRLIQAKIVDTTVFNRFLYNLFLPVGYRIADFRAARKRSNMLWRFLYSLAYVAVFRDLKDKVGLSKIRVAYTAAAPISPDVIRFFRAVGVNIKQLYGGSEQGLVTLHRDDDVRPETSGPEIPGVSVKLKEDGEIMIKGENLFCGYYKDPKATEEKLRDGWYYSGDFGHMTEDGHLIVMDRMKDLRELSSGQKFSPQYAEIRLRFSPYIKDAFTIGGGDKSYVTCIINIDMDNVGRWAEARRIPYTTFTDLSQKPEVIELVRKDIERINKTLPEWARIRKFANLHREFDPDEEELTRTRKIKRTVVEDRYHYLIDALYSDANELTVEAPVTYRDGRKGTITTAIKINSLDLEG